MKIVPYLDRDDLVHYTTHTVLHNLAEGMILVVIVLFLFLGNVRGALIVSFTIPFACCLLPSVSTCGISPRICFLWARWISAWWWMAP